MSMVKVAEKAGVSYSTVSRVINGKVNSESATAKKVFQAMKDVGYTPPPPATRRGPRPNKSRSVGTGNVAVLLLGLTARITESLTAAEVLHAVESRLSEVGLNLILASCTDANQLPACASRDRVDGVILFTNNQYPAEKIMDKLSKLPAVWVFTHEIDWGDHIRPNNELIARLAADYFIERNHTNVAYLNYWHSRTAFRKRAMMFKDFMQQKGGTVQTLTSCSTPDSFEQDLEDLADKLVSLDPRPTGLFIGNDRQLPYVYSALERRGIQPGKDITVLGCDNHSLPMSMIKPRPATIDIGCEEMGRRAVDQLLWRKQNAEVDEGVVILVRPRLVLNEADAPIETGPSLASGWLS